MLSIFIKNDPEHSPLCKRLQMIVCEHHKMNVHGRFHFLEVYYGGESCVICKEIGNLTEGSNDL